MAARKLGPRYLPAAETDLTEIYRWILNDSPARAASFLNRLDDRLGSLAAHREAGYRVLTIDSYLVFYMVRGRLVEIHRVIHGSRSLDDIA